MSYKPSITFLRSKISAHTMEEIQLENEAVYWLGSVISLAEVDIRKNAATEKLKEHFQLTYDRKTLRIEVKAS